MGPPILKSSIRSWNWPWMSPQTVTGHFCRGIKSVASGHFIERGVSRTTGCTLDSSCRTSRAYSMASQHGCPTPHSITRAVDDAENGARRGQRRTVKPAQARATKRQSCLPGGKPPPRSSMQLQEGGMLTLSQSLWTSASASCLQFIKLSIQPSSVGIEAGSFWTGDTSAGALPTSSMLVSMMCDAAVGGGRCGRGTEADDGEKK